MARRERKYTLDTNIFIRGFRESQAGIELQRFHAAFAPFEYLSSVVAHELRAGALTSTAAAALEANVLAPFERRGRLLVPSYSVWKGAAAVLARMATKERTPLRDIPKSFVNDVLLALTCRDAGVVLVSENLRDLERIQPYVRFDLVTPWPRPA